VAPVEVKKHQILDTDREFRMLEAMSSKSVDLDEEAYEILSRQRQAGQSFSDVVKERLGPKRQGTGTAADLLRLVKDLDISEDMLDRVEEVIQARSQSPIRDVDL
jgi:predicted CopG family antitoxin